MMPDYHLSESKVVCTTIYGSIVDLAYSRLLMQNTNLPLEDSWRWDRVQKKRALPDETIKYLRRAGLIEGRKPHLHVSAVVAKVAASQAECIRTRAQDDAFYVKMITDYLGKASRKEIDNLLWKKFSHALDDEQKTRKISNLLLNLRRSKRICKVAGSRKGSHWKLVE